MEGEEENKWLEQEEQDNVPQKKVSWIETVKNAHICRPERGRGHGRAGGVQEAMAGGAEAR